MASLNLASSTDSYTVANSLSFLPTEACTIAVTNAAVMVQFATVNEGEQFSAPGAYSYNGEEKFCIPGIYTWRPSDFQGRKIARVQFRSAALGKPAIVSITA